MKPVAAGGVQYRVPPEPSRWPAIALAAAVHAGLLAFLYIGVSWQNNAPVAVEAEVWDMKTQAAAPPPPPPPEVVEPQPEPQPAPKVEQPPPPPPVEQPVAPKPPDIALEREKQRKLEKLRQLEEKKLEEAELAKERKADELAEKKAQELAEKKAEKKAAELAEKKLADKKLADQVKADKLAKARHDAEEQKRLDKVRADEMRRITAGAGTSGEAAKSTAPRSDSGYIASITAKVKGTTSYSGDTDVAGNPKAEFKVEQLPTGEIISARLVKSSGIPAFDNAVEKGIIKASPLPKKKDGTVERTLVIAFKMKD
ncbi:MAG TPA: energy transducer TonB [Telluria sp.]|nr:energy transducer TonB [Telluria sp.]